MQHWVQPEQGKASRLMILLKYCGKALLIYNCSESMSSYTFTRILKGMVITGSWMCFDEFNRFSSQILSVIGEQLSILFRYRSFGNKVMAEFENENINIRSDFQIFMTYNPNYEGRKHISLSILNKFRTISMVNPDKSMIYKLLLFCNRFRKG